MSFYPDKINERFSAAKNAGQAKRADASGTGVSFLCGTAVKFSLEINAQTGEIIEAKYKSNGCGYAIAAADVLAEIVSGQKLTELHGLDENILLTQIERELGEFSAERAHCPAIAIDALQAALSDFRRAQLEEFTGEKALICTCFGVSEEIIEKVIAVNYCESVEQVTEICSAGGGCGSCRFLIQEMIDVYESEQM